MANRPPGLTLVDLERANERFQKMGINMRDSLPSERTIVHEGQVYSMTPLDVQLVGYKIYIAVPQRENTVRAASIVEHELVNLIKKAYPSMLWRDINLTSKGGQDALITIGPHNFFTPRD